MIQIGDYNLLNVERSSDFGLFLTDKEKENEVLLPNRYVTPEMHEGDLLEVFVYNDSEDRLVATTEEPLATANEFAWLQVLDVNAVGAFLDWGLPRDLFVPYSEMQQKLLKKKYYPVYVYVDDSTQRMLATTKIQRYLKPAEQDAYQQNEEVQIFLYEELPIGYKTIVDDQFRGMLYKDQIFQEVQLGAKMQAFVKEVREDGKIDVSLQKHGYAVMGDTSDVILHALHKAGGFLPYHDKSDAQEIMNVFGMSKKNFKRSIGALYKARKIVIEEKGIKLIQKN
jgi:predicted RNA-binding protein (virulence factor B family)